MSDGLYTHCKDCQLEACRSEGRTKRAYKNMIQRCYNPKASKYPWYGAVGVQVCEEWRASYENFRFDMGECPEGKSICRYGAVGNYEPSNCDWMTPAEKDGERRENIRLAEYVDRKNCKSTRLQATWSAAHARLLAEGSMGKDTKSANVVLVRSVSQPVRIPKILCGKSRSQKISI